MNSTTTTTTTIDASSPTTQAPHDAHAGQNGFSEAQLISVPVARTVCATLSILGSTCIAYMILSKRKKRLNQSYHRIMLALSLVDIVWSAWFAVGPLAVPRETGAFLAMGNAATCNAQGFFLQLGVTVLVYDSFLMLYHMLVIRYNVSERVLVQKEKYVHLFVLIFSITQATTFLILGHYTPVGAGPSLCYIGLQRDPVTGETIDSSGNATTVMMGHIMVFVTSGLLSFISFGSIGIIFWTVRRQASTSQRFHNDRAKENARMVLVQSTAYGVAFVCTFAFPSILIAFDAWEYGEVGNPNVIFAVELLSNIFITIQGFFNMLVYIRPRFLRVRKMHPDRSFLFHFHQTITSDTTLEVSRQEQFQGSSSERAARHRYCLGKKEAAIIFQEEDHDELDPSQVLQKEHQRRISLVQERDERPGIATDLDERPNDVDNEQNQPSSSATTMDLSSDDSVSVRDNNKMIARIHPASTASNDEFGDDESVDGVTTTISSLQGTSMKPLFSVSTPIVSDERSRQLKSLRLEDSTMDFPRTNEWFSTEGQSTDS